MMMAVMSGALTVSEGARRLGLSRNHFQSLLHRALGSLIEELAPKAGGRPPMPERERQLEEETGRLRLENERLKRRVETAERILGVASGLLRGRMDRGARRERAEEAGHGGRVSARRERLAALCALLARGLTLPGRPWASGSTQHGLALATARGARRAAGQTPWAARAASLR